MKEIATVSQLFLNCTAHLWTSCLVLKRNRGCSLLIPNPSRSAEVSASWSCPLFRAAPSPLLPDDLALPLSSLTRCTLCAPLSIKVRRLMDTPRLLYSTSSWFSWIPSLYCVFVVKAWCPFQLLSSSLFFFPTDYYIVSPSSQSCHNSPQDECWSLEWPLGKCIQTPLRSPKEPLSVPPFACLSPRPPCPASPAKLLI